MVDVEHAQWGEGRGELHTAATIHPLPGAIHPLPRTIHLLQGAIHPLPGAIHPLPRTIHLLPGDIQLLPGAIQLLPGAVQLLLGAIQLLLRTIYLLLGTHCLWELLKEPALDFKVLLKVLIGQEEREVQLARKNTPLHCVLRSNKHTCWKQLTDRKAWSDSMIIILKAHRMDFWEVAEVEGK